MDLVQGKFYKTITEDFSTNYFLVIGNTTTLTRGVRLNIFCIYTNNGIFREFKSCIHQVFSTPVLLNISCIDFVEILKTINELPNSVISQIIEAYNQIN
jgi:hypothetical protein